MVERGCGAALSVTSTAEHREWCFERIKDLSTDFSNRQSKAWDTTQHQDSKLAVKYQPIIIIIMRNIKWIIKHSRDHTGRQRQRVWALLRFIQQQCHGSSADEQDKGMFVRVLFIVTQSHPTVSAIFSWNKISDEQVMSNNWRDILYYSHKITFPAKVWGWRRQEREHVHEHYSFPPHFGTTAQKNPKHKWELLTPEILGYPNVFYRRLCNEQCHRVLEELQLWSLLALQEVDRLHAVNVVSHTLS